MSLLSILTKCEEVATPQMIGSTSTRSRLAWYMQHVSNHDLTPQRCVRHYGISLCHHHSDHSCLGGPWGLKSFFFYRNDQFDLVRMCQLIETHKGYVIVGDLDTFEHNKRHAHAILVTYYPSHYDD